MSGITERELRRRLDWVVDAVSPGEYSASLKGLEEEFREPTTIMCDMLLASNALSVMLELLPCRCDEFNSLILRVLARFVAVPSPRYRDALVDAGAVRELVDLCEQAQTDDIYSGRSHGHFLLSRFADGTPKHLDALRETDVFARIVRGLDASRERDVFYHAGVLHLCGSLLRTATRYSDKYSISDEDVRVLIPHVLAVLQRYTFTMVTTEGLDVLLSSLQRSEATAAFVWEQPSLFSMLVERLHDITSSEVVALVLKFCVIATRDCDEVASNRAARLLDADVLRGIQHVFRARTKERGVSLRLATCLTNLALGPFRDRLLSEKETLSHVAMMMLSSDAVVRSQATRFFAALSGTPRSQELVEVARELDLVRHLGALVKNAELETQTRAHVLATIEGLIDLDGVYVTSAPSRDSIVATIRTDATLVTMIHEMHLPRLAARLAS